ncbi:acyl-CoA dehydrogenase family protein [Streptomyces syringium]|uniref:acyl-CoA dehydrogenase family protein n=1 Tax=Streptomyces syringium TaxID=76729 RepID=UPI00341AD568
MNTPHDNVAYDVHNVHETDLSVAAHKARDIAAAHAEAADTERELRPEALRALVTAGFPRHFVPRRWGGGGGGFLEITDAIMTVAEGCASAGWCASILAYGSRVAAFLPEEGQRDLWSGGPDTVIASSMLPVGRPEAATGGWRLSGRWPYTSAAGHAEWALVAGPAGPPEPDGTPRNLFFALPREAFTVETTWDTLGMRGTGSHTLVADDVFVPDHRTFPMSDVSTKSVDGRPVVPLRSIAGMTFAPPVLGAAQGAMEIAGRQLLGGDDTVTPDRLGLVRAAGDVELARLLVERVARDADGTAAVPRPDWPSWSPWDCARAAELATEAVDRLMSAAGTRGFSQSHPFQRAWRDVHTAASHVRLRPEPAAAAWLSAMRAACGGL